MLLSSQYPEVGFITTPSPHISVQTLEVVLSPSVHVQFGSTLQREFHPSLLLKFPSSQYPFVGAVTTPSPHMSVHTLAVVELPDVHVHKDSTAHTALHPSPPTVLPSSQYPDLIIPTIPSPQVSVQVEAEVGLPPVQVAPVSTAQDKLHPSPFTKFPSSQTSVPPGASFPFPHTS